jgi:hypothetical protein
LGAVLTRAFDDCLVSESIFKLLHIFGSLIQRKLIAQELSVRDRFDETYKPVL